MKGIILSGGSGTRLLPLTATTSKQLLPVYDRQMIFYPLNTLIKAGIKDILIIVAPDHSGQYLNLLGSIFEKHGIQVSFSVQKIPRGLAEAFIIGEDFMDDEPVAMILGDNIFEDDFTQAIQSFKEGGRVFAVKVPDPERSGVVEFDKNMKVLSIEEKPEKPKSNYIIPGLYIYDNRVSGIAKKLKPSERGEIEITDIHNYYLNEGVLDVHTLKGKWFDAGTFDSLLEASQFVKDRKVAEKFDPLLNEAIQEFNKEVKKIAKALIN
jgi:glucose-1-phosphate thymidylyltransferase